MKKLIYLILFAFFLGLTYSCVGPLKFNRTIYTDPRHYTSPKFEFIGFKDMTTIKSYKVDGTLTASINRLVDKGLTIDRSEYFSGIFSFVELERYKSLMRYISYIEVGDDWKFWWEEYGVAPGEKTFIHFGGTFRVSIYDTTIKKIVYSENIQIGPYCDAYNGWWSLIKKRETFNKIFAYYSGYLSTTFLNVYDNAFNYLDSLEKE